MKILKKSIAFALLVCICISLLPPALFTSAAETGATYELDTDGIDTGAEYLIVKAYKPWGSNTTTYYSLQGADAGNPGTAKIVTTDGDQVIPFDGIEDHTWKVEDAGDGKYFIKHGSNYLYISNTSAATAPSYQSTPFALSIGNNNTVTAAKGEYIIHCQHPGSSSIFYLTASTSYNPLFSSLGTSRLSYIGSGLRFYKKISSTATVTFHGNGNTAGQAPDPVTLNKGSAYPAPGAPEGFVREDHLFSHWNDRQDGSGTSYFPNDPIPVEGDLELYAQWVRDIQYPVTVTTFLDGKPTDIASIVPDAVGLFLRLNDSDDTTVHLTKTETGIYAAEASKSGNYSVHILHSDNSYQDTGYRVSVTDETNTAELSYFTVSYNLNGGTLDAPIDDVISPAGTRVTASVNAPTRPGRQFLGWMDQNNDLFAPGEVVTESLQEKTTLSAAWDQGQPTSFVIRYLERTTYKELHQATTVSGASAGVTVMANQQVQSIVGYTYIGAGINGQYYGQERDPYITLSEDASQNVLILFYTPDPDLHLHKDATLENDGTYTIELDMFTHNNPVTTLVDQDIPLDIVLVLDQSSSMRNGDVLEDLKTSVTNFIDLVADHGRTHETDHRIAIVGYGSGNNTIASGDGPVAGSYDKNNLVTSYDPDLDGHYTNTGVFDAHGDFHAFPITGFTYEKYNGVVEAPEEGISDRKATAYYTYADGEYLLLTYHSVYRHMISESEAYAEHLQGKEIFGYIDGQFIKLSRNPNGMWITEDKILYSSPEFFTRHEKVWTHRHGIEGREIHAYMIDGVFTPVDGHHDVYIRKETTENPEKNIYRDALIPVTMGAKGSGYVDFAFDEAVSNLGAKGQTYVSLGMEMANRIFEANPLSELDEDVERQRIIVVFTDGKPGDSVHFEEEESNTALAKAAFAHTEYGAQIFTIGLYGDTAVDTNADAARTKKDQEDFLMGLSSNFPTAQKLEDVWQTVTYIPATTGFKLTEGGPYYVKVNNDYYPLSQRSGEYNNYVYQLYWYYEIDGVKTDVLKYPSNAVVPIGANGVMTGLDGNPVTIYRKSGTGYKEMASHNYYLSAADPSQLEEDFATIVRELTTKISTEVTMRNDAILRDIMGQGLVLTENTVISVYKQAGTFIPEEKRVEWSDQKILLDSLEIPDDPADTLRSGKGITVDGVHIPYISVYNLGASNPTDPTDADYHPHTVDIVGYEYNNENWYMNAGSPNGFRLVATITHVEARDDVVWNHAQGTNNNQSGLWLPATDTSSRELLEAFVEPSTVFVERAYVLDYGKEFTLSDWYFDDADGQNATPIHLDFDITDGMNHFEVPTTVSTGNDTRYGNVRLQDEKVTYSPISMNWGGYDQFYVFGNTWRKTVHAQSANENGNLWNKVTVIPANNIYYEDSFITTEDTTQHGIEGFTFTGAWTVVGSNSGNVEIPEHIEAKPYGDVHGWTDSLSDDLTFTDGSAHGTGMNKEIGAKAEFTFTGTGVEVYTRTNAQSGMVVAVLNKKTVDSDGKETTTLAKSIAIDNLAVSGNYYHIPTVSFKDLDYGTYSLQLIATVTGAAAEGMRYEYYIDGVRIHNPLGDSTNHLPTNVTNAYGLETNAVFTEVRDILLDYKDFNTALPDSTDGKMGAVFIDWVREGQGSGADQPGVGVPSYEIGTFEAYGPKNEVYLSAGQAIVLKVAEGNTYYVGLKSLTGAAVLANVSGIDVTAAPTSIPIVHSTDMYYRINPMNGYIVIQNGNSEGDALLSVTNIRTTNLNAPAVGGGILPVAQQAAIAAMRTFSARLAEQESTPMPDDTAENAPAIPAPQQFEVNLAFTNKLFASVRKWLKIV